MLLEGASNTILYVFNPIEPYYSCLLVHGSFEMAQVYGHLNSIFSSNLMTTLVKKNDQIQHFEDRDVLFCMLSKTVTFFSLS